MALRKIYDCPAKLSDALAERKLLSEMAICTSYCAQIKNGCRLLSKPSYPNGEIAISISAESCGGMEVYILFMPAAHPPITQEKDAKESFVMLSRSETSELEIVNVCRKTLWTEGK